MKPYTHAAIVITIAALLGLLVLTGCEFQQPSEEEITRTIRSAAKAGTLLVFREFDEEDRAEIAGKALVFIELQIVPWFDGETKFNEQVIESLIEELDFIDPDYRLLAAAALETLGEYVTLPPAGKVLGPKAVGRLREFFEGVKDACRSVALND